jgi:hypothetical protein
VLPAFNPSNITSYGYDLVFDTEWNDTSDVNTSATPGPGSKFYTRLFSKWGGASNAPSLSVSGGVLTIGGGQISSIAPTSSGTSFVGTSFQGGGYFEARLAWNRSGDVANPSKPISDTNWWPSFYSVPAEYFTGSQWPGQATGYTHFVENDWFEAWSGNYYGATVHDWWGDYSSAGCNGISTPLGYCEISNDGTSTVHPTDPALDGVAKNQNRVSMGTSNPAGFHIIGALWVSAKHSASGFGYVEYFFDGAYTGVWKSWKPLPSGLAPPPSLPYIFSELDDNHSVIFIGAPSNQVLQVDWIHAWQLKQSLDSESNPPVTPESGFTGPNGSAAR